MATLVQEPRADFHLCSKKKRHIFVVKTKILQDNTKMMHRYSFNLYNMM